MLDRRFSNNSAIDRGGELPGSPSALLSQPYAPLPINPNLPLPSSQSPQGNTQQTRSRALPGSTLPFRPAMERESTLNRSSDLYNPTGIPMPQAWQGQSNLSQTAAAASGAEAPTSNQTNTTSPLQSAIDRVNAPGNSAVSSESAVRPGELGLPRSIDPVGAIPSTPLQPPGVQPTSRATGYTLPPAFRTPENTTPFYSSPIPASSSPQGDNLAQPEGIAPLITPSPASGATPFEDSRSNSIQPLGGSEINSFSNP